jgi:hypothetical protein
MQEGWRKAEEAVQRDGAVARGRPRKPKSWLLLSNQRKPCSGMHEGRRKAEEAVQRDGAVAGGRPRKPCSAMAPWPEEGRGSCAARWRRGRRKAEEAEELAAIEQPAGRAAGCRKAGGRPRKRRLRQRAASRAA